MRKNTWILKRNTLHLSVLLTLLSIPVTGNTQILNIERLRLEKDTSRSFLMKTTFGLNVYNRSAAADAPVNLFGYNVDINGIYYPKKHAFILMSNFDYLRINEDDFLNFGFVHGRINLFRENTINYEVYLQYSYDNFRGLHPRWLGGGGIRYGLAKSDAVTATLGVGLLYEHEKWAYPGTSDIVEVNLLKSSNYLSFRYTINDFVDFNMVGYYQTGYDQMISRLRNRFNGSLILNTRLSRRFSLATSYDLSYEDRPIVPITPLIYAFKTGLSIDI